ESDDLAMAISDIVNAIYSENSSFIGDNELFTFYATGNVSGQNFSLPNILLSQVADLNEDDSDQTDWDDMILNAQHHEYVKSVLPLKTYGDLSADEIIVAVQTYCKSKSYNIDSFIVNDNLQISGASGLESWVTEVVV
ncbi:hypothetical protein N8865_01935, partial [Francisellaceae bacterium]|nr:hypothetical protein [Francisellaceae bacterium]